MGLTHASFFSGVGGLDLGLERAGWRTVSFSEIDPYASAVLAERWPGVPNLGDIVRMAAGREPDDADDRARSVDRPTAGASTSDCVQRATPERDAAGLEREPDWRDAELWTGGFPCQDLSVAGKRRGMGAGTRSGLAFAFLDLVGRHRPRFVLLENVPGLLSSHAGRDFGTLLSTLVELGYGVGYRVLDARYFGVPQRRRRVFILGDSAGGRAGAERAAEVLSVGSRCHRHPPTGVEAGEDAAAGARPGVDIARTVVGTAGKRHDEDIDTLVPTVRSHPRPGSNSDGLLAIAPTLRGFGHGWQGQHHSTHAVLSSPSDPDRVRAADGLAGRAHDRGVARAISASAGHHGHGSPRGDGGDNLVTSYRKATKAHSDDDWERWEPADETDPLTANGLTARTATAVLGGRGVTDDPLLPLGLDSHRYRCCGNGVVADVAEWIGHRLAAIA